MLLDSYIEQGLYNFSKKKFQGLSPEFSWTQTGFSKIPNFPWNPFIPKISRSILQTVNKIFLTT